MLVVSPSPTPQDEDDQMLSIAQIAAIVIGVSVGTLLLVIISVLVGYCLWYVCICLCVYMHTLKVFICLSNFLKIIINVLHINYICIGCIIKVDDFHLRMVLRNIQIPMLKMCTNWNIAFKVQED